MTHILNTPLTKEDLAKMTAGDTAYLSGVIYTARDAAHARLCTALENNEELPVDLKNQVVFYAGPAPAPPGMPTGSIGPTTSGRMDAYTPQLLKYGVLATIGKGERNAQVIQAIAETGSVYFAAIGGCAAHMAACITKCDVVAYDDLGPESIKRLTVKDLPLICAVDSKGQDAYAMGKEKYLQEQKSV